MILRGKKTKKKTAINDFLILFISSGASEAAKLERSEKKRNSGTSQVFFPFLKIFEKSYTYAMIALYVDLDTWT